MKKKYWWSVPKSKRVNIGRRMKMWRKHYELTQERAAEILDLSVKTIQDYEQGRRGHGLDNWAYRYLLAQTQITKKPRDFTVTLPHRSPDLLKELEWFPRKAKRK
jgi:transcriptional regulator with XRE-family HTH domain